MSNWFFIRPAVATVRLDENGAGQISFTVSNASGLPQRVLVKPIALGATKIEWLSVGGAVERSFTQDGVDQIPVKIQVPPDTPSALYPFRLDIMSAALHGADRSQGEPVAFEVPAHTKNTTWWQRNRKWIIPAAAAVLAVGGVLTWLVLRRSTVPDVVGKSLADAKKIFGESGLSVGQLSNAFQEGKEPATILSQEPKAGDPKPSDATVDLVLQEGPLYLSDLDETVRAVPHGSLGKDKAYWTNSIIVNGTQYAKALVTHAEGGLGTAVIEYVVPKGARSFRAVLGLAEPPSCPNNAGSVMFRVAIDGVDRYASKVIRFGEQIDLNLQVTEGTTLTLSVDDAGDGIACDQATWANARFER